MASRQVRKLLQQQRNEELVFKNEEEELLSDEEKESPPFNPFSLLESEDEAQERDDDAAQEEEEEKEAPAPASVPAPSKKGGSKKKSKKAKKKGGEDEIDAVLKELSLADGNLAQAGAAGGASASAPAAAVQPKHLQVLSVDTRALRGDDELRRIFGASVIASVDREEASQNNRMRGRGAQRAFARRVMKKGLLVTPKDHWPVLDTSAMSMQSNGWKDGVQQFQYTWSPGYRYTQRAFEQCQATYDPNAVAALLQQAPYHVDSLLTMYDLYRHLGENQYAEETLLRALYALEMAWHPAFDIRTANCRLDFQVPENRALFITLFRHVQALSRSGCHRTALECCKLLLALEPQDPLGATCLIDYLALRAESYEYLRDFALHFEGDESLAIRPNFSFSLALARLRREQQQQQRCQQQQQQAAAAEARASEAMRRGSGAKGGRAGSREAVREASGMATAGGQTGGGDEGGVQEQSALQLMVAAVMLHPSAVPRLQSKLLEKGAGREPRWGQLLLRPLFTQPHDAASASLQHLGSIFVERSHMLWKVPDALELLYSGALAAADLAEGKSTEATAAIKELSLTAEDWQCVRQESFPDSSVNDFRHYRLADFSDNVNALPREELQAAMGGGDEGMGLGGGIGNPQQDTRQLEMEQRALAELQEHVLAAQQFQQQQGNHNLTEDELRNANPVMMLLRSLLPWVNAGQQPGYGDDDRREGQHPDEGNRPQEQ